MLRSAVFVILQAVTEVPTDLWYLKYQILWVFPITDCHCKSKGKHWNRVDVNYILALEILRRGWANNFKQGGFTSKQLTPACGVRCKVTPDNTCRRAIFIRYQQAVCMLGKSTALHAAIKSGRVTAWKSIMTSNTKKPSSSD